MSDANVNATITSNITTNGVGKITGAILASTLLAITAWVVAFYAPLASPTLTGAPTSPTQTAGDASPKIATDAFVANAIGNSPTISSPTITGFTANLPLIGGGTGAVVSGSRSGSTTDFATITGSLISGHCVSIDGSGNLIDAGGACTTGGGGGTVSAGSAGNLGYYSTSSTVISPLSLGSGVLTALGVNVGSAGAPVLFNGAGGTPTSMVLTNATSLPNAGLLNSSVTLGSTNVALGATATTLAGLSSVTSTAFVGALTGHASLDLPLTGGTLTGALTYGGVTLANSVIGTGSMVLSASPTLTGHLTINDISGGAVPAVNVTTANHNLYSVAGVLISANVDYGSFGDGNTTFGFVVQGGKNADTASTTGSWQLGSVRYTGFGGGDGSAFFTANQSLMAPVAGVHNNSGHFFGNNPECLIPTGMTPTECTGEEIDIETLSNPSGDRHGLRIIDIGSTGSHATDDSGLSILSSGIGWTYGLELGSQTGQFPIVAGGALITTSSSSAALNAGIYLQNLTGIPTLAWIALPPNQKGLCFGSGSCNGGGLFNTSATNGGLIVFGSNQISFNWASAEVTFSSAGAITALGSIISTSPSGGVGYATGAGGTVTQATSKATGVSLNSLTGAITMNNALLAAGTIVSFTLTDSSIAATDTLVLNHISGGTIGSYTLNAGAAAGSATIYVRNNTAGSLSEAIVIEFAVLKGATS